MKPSHNPDAIIHGILSRFADKERGHTGQSRATLVLEPALCALAPALQDANFLVVVPADLSTFSLRRELLSGRVLVTRNTLKFLYDAPIFDAGIVGLDALADIYIAPTLWESQTAMVISKGFLEFDIAGERGPFLLLLHPEGRHVFRRLS
jgi:hypothetical protein